MQHLFHIVDRQAWDAADRVYRPASFDDEGFVHCSFAGQLAATADRYCRGVLGLVVLEIDPALLDAEVRIEGGFPHVYGPVPVSAVIAVRDLLR